MEGILSEMTIREKIGKCSSSTNGRKEGGLMRGRVENRRWSKREGRVISFQRLNSTFHALSRLFIARQQVNAYISGVRV